MLDIGGGFPARYGDPVPSIEQIGMAVDPCAGRAPALPPALLVAAEPGRHLVAETAVMVAEVLGREVRAGEDWLYLDVGAYNGLMETQQTVGQWRFPLWTSRADHGAVDAGAVHGHRPELRQLRHHVLRCPAAGHDRRRRPSSTSARPAPTR